MFTKRTVYHEKSGDVRLLSHYDVIFDAENDQPLSGEYTSDAGKLLFSTIYKRVSDTSYAIADVNADMEIVQTLIIKKNRSGRFAEEITSADMKDGKVKYIVRKKVYNRGFWANEFIEGYIIDESAAKYDNGSLAISYIVIQEDAKGNPLYVLEKNSNDQRKLIGYKYEYYNKSN